MDYDDFNDYMYGEYEQTEIKKNYAIGRKEEKKGKYNVDSEETFAPHAGSRWAKYKTQWCYSTNKGMICPKGDVCFYAHTFNEMRNENTPILLSIKRKVDKASPTLKCSQIHLTKEMEEDYKQIKSKNRLQQLQIKELNLKIERLQIENN